MLNSCKSYQIDDLLISLANYHAFLDGNKRTAAAAAYSKINFPLAFDLIALGAIGFSLLYMHRITNYIIRNKPYS